MFPGSYAGEEGRVNVSPRIGNEAKFSSELLAPDLKTRTYSVAYFHDTSLKCCFGKLVLRVGLIHISIGLSMSKSV